MKYAHLICALALWACDSGSDTETGTETQCLQKTSDYYAGEPGDGLEFIDYPVQQAGAGRGAGVLLDDIVEHLPAQYGNTYYDEDPITWGHETSHGIHAHLRNNFNDSGRRANAFYVLEDRGVIVPEPGVRKSAANQYVPEALRGSRYDLYIAGSPSWDDTPLYIWDEWNAYVNGGLVGVDLVNGGNWDRGWRDGVAGQLEFTVYALALAMAVEAEDPDYFAQEPQFLEFLAWNSKRAMENFREGKALEAFTWDRQDAYYAALREGPEGEPIREFARRIFGRAWADAWVFGLEAPPEEAPPIEPEPEPEPEPDPETPEEPPLAPPAPESDGHEEGGEPDGQEDPNDPGTPQDPGPAPVADADGDGVSDAGDRCSGTIPGATVWPEGEDWAGCAEGQMRDSEVVPPAGPGVTPGPGLPADADADGVPDGSDQCSQTPAGARTHGPGDWWGCTEGETRDRDKDC